MDAARSAQATSMITCATVATAATLPSPTIISPSTATPASSSADSATPVPSAPSTPANSPFAQPSACRGATPLAAADVLALHRAGRLALLDTRGARLFSESHVRGAACLLTLPLNLRRLAAGTRPLASAVLPGTGCAKLWSDSGAGAGAGAALSGRFAIALYDADGAGAGPAMRAAVAGIRLTGAEVSVVAGGYAALRAAARDGDLQSGGAEGWSLRPVACVGSVSAPASTVGTPLPAPASRSLHGTQRYRSGNGEGPAVCCTRHTLAPQADTIAEVLPGLFVGCQHDARDGALLQKHNIRYIVNATLECASPACLADGHRPKTLHVAIGDTVAADITAHFERAAGFIHQALDAGVGVLVHCSAGVSRSPTLAVAYLMLKRGMHFNDALARVVAARPCACPNLAFTAALSALDSSLARTVPVANELPLSPVTTRRPTSTTSWGGGFYSAGSSCSGILGSPLASPRHASPSAQIAL